MNKRHWMKQSKQENLIYLAVWGLLFASPLISLYVRMMSDQNLPFDWTEVLIVWRKFMVYLLLFLIHNFFLAPLLVHSHKRVAYFSIRAAVLTAFIVFQCNSRPPLQPKPMQSGPLMEQPGRHEPPPFDKPDMPDRPDMPEKPGMPDDPGRFDGHRPERLRVGERSSGMMPPPIVGERDILAIVVLILMFGANLGIKSYFRSRDDRKRLAELEKQNLEQQLAYLRYQINPHFFMNTLNNIHALIDIDPMKAQETVVELSKMMRYVLYEGDRQDVPLTKEMAFVRTYVKLMQLRYSDKVRITLDLPAEMPDRTIPPLILISFIENAFKHGVSYQQESFIEVKIVLEGSVMEAESMRFECRNSKVNVPNEEKGGVGLANVRQRLDLIYNHNYTLSIHDDADVYTVELNIPLL